MPPVVVVVSSFGELESAVRWMEYYSAVAGMSETGRWLLSQPLNKRTNWETSIVITGVAGDKESQYQN